MEDVCQSCKKPVRKEDAISYPCDHIQHRECTRNFGPVKACSICTGEGASGGEFLVASNGPQDGSLDMTWKFLSLKQDAGFPITHEDFLETGPFIFPENSDRAHAARDGDRWVNQSPVPFDFSTTNVDPRTFVYQVARQRSEASERAKGGSVSRCIDVEVGSVLNDIIHSGTVSVGQFAREGFTLSDMRQIMLNDDSTPLSVPFLVDGMGMSLGDLCGFPDMTWSTFLEMRFDYMFLLKYCDAYHETERSQHLCQMFSLLGVDWVRLVRDVVQPYIEVNGANFDQNPGDISSIAYFAKLGMDKGVLKALGFNFPALFNAIHVKKRDFRTFFRMYNLDYLCDVNGLRLNKSHLLLLTGVTKENVFFFLLDWLKVSEADAKTYFKIKIQ